MDVTLSAQTLLPDPHLPLLVQRYAVTAAVPVHGHDFHELAIIISGSAEHSYHGPAVSRGPVVAGDVVVLAPEERHGFTSCRALVVYNVLVTAALLARSAPRLKAVPGLADFLFTEPRLRRADGVRPRLRVDPATLTRCVTACDAIAEETTHRQPGSTLAAQGLLDHLLVLLGRAWSSSVAERDTRLVAAQDAAVAAAMAVMEEHLDDASLHLADIAAAAGLSPHWFSEVFARHTGVSPWHWLTTLRVERAKHLLRTTPIPITRLALEVGFGDSSYFARVFRAHTGVSPRAWRTGENSATTGATCAPRQ